MTKAEALQALAADNVAVTAPIVEIIDTLQHALSELHPEWSWERCLARADALAFRLAE